MSLIAKPRQIVYPGDVLSKGMDKVPGENVIREGDDLIATVVGIFDFNGRVAKIIPLTGQYVPKIGDTIIGSIIEFTFSGWVVDIGTYTNANIGVSEVVREYVDINRTDIKRFLDIDEKIVAKITSVSKTRGITLTMKGPGLRKLEGGHVIEITGYKIPRLIGKAGSMINMIKEMTKTTIIAGQNGRVWINGPKEGVLKAISAINLIEDESQKKGLTDKIKKMLGDKKCVTKRDLIIENLMN